MDDFIVLIQGNSDNVKELKTALKGYNFLFSTWVGQESFYDEKDLVVFNEKPEICGPLNINLQKTTTLNGLKKIKSLGYKRVLKLRSDLIPTNFKEFIKYLDNNDLNFLSWCNHEVTINCKGYLVDYLMSGPIDYMIKLWSFDIKGNCLVPEVFITKQYINKLINKVNVNFFIDKLNVNNDLNWVKYNLKLSSYNDEKNKNLYVKYDLINDLTYLNNIYVNLYDND